MIQTFVTGIVLTIAMATLVHAQSNLPPAVQADIVMQEIYADLKAENVQKVLTGIDRYRELPVDMPPRLLLLESKAASRTGDPVRAYLSLEQYLAKADRSEEGYKEAVASYTAVRAAAEKKRTAAELEILSKQRAENEVAIRSERARADSDRMVKEQQALDVKRLVTSLQMITVPGGTFQMGDLIGSGEPAEKPAHSVTVKAFRLARTEVTVGQFRQFITATGYLTDAEKNVGNAGCLIANIQAGKSEWTADRNWRSPGFPLQDDQPVVCVSWNDARAFIEWLNGATDSGFRLPTEAEWEYAARAGSAAAYPWGSNPDDGCAHANGADLTPWSDGRRWSKNLGPMNCLDGHFYSAPVGRYSPNAFGLHDMIGNVWEWTGDCQNDTYQGAPIDGSAWLTGDCSQRITRGGSWVNAPARLRVSLRQRFWIGYRDADQGFRLAQDL